MLKSKKGYVLIILLTLLQHSFLLSQTPCVVDLGNDTMICVNPITLDATANFETYLWQDGSTNSTLSATSQGIYSVTVETTGQTVVTNGHFEAGNVGFISAYIYNATSLWTEGTYWVGPDANTVHSAFVGTDHTPAPGVNFLVVNGSSTPGTMVWGQSITVIPNTDYKFSAWVCSVVASSPAILQFSINNIMQGANFTAPPAVNTWIEFFIIWNSGPNTTANISIINQNSASSGNDFGLDDISFRPVIICSDNILISPNNVSASAVGINVDCFGDPSGGASLTVTGGYSPYTYLWSDNSVNQNLANVFSGSYTVTVSDASNCETTTSVIVNEPATPVTASLVSSPVDCFGESTGAIDITASGGNSPYSYHWSNGQNIEDIINLAANVYYVTVTDDHGCIFEGDAEVTQPDELLAIMTGTDLSCHGDTDAFAMATVSGGMLPYIYNWSTGGFTPGLTNLAAGAYSVTVTDANQCVTSGSIEFEEPAPVLLYTSADQTICLSKDANIVGNTLGGTTPYEYNWTPGGYNTASITVSPSISTEYCLYVIDDNNCRSNTRCVTVFVKPPLSFELSSNEDSICKGDTIILSSYVSGGDGGPYFLQLYNGPIIQTNEIAIPENSQSYVVIASDGCGTPTQADTVEITVFDAPPVSFRSDILEGCEALSIKFLLNIENSGNTYFWDFDDAANFNFSTEPNPVHLFRNPGIYTVSLTVENEIGCKSTHTESGMITVHPRPRSIFTHEPEAAVISDPVIYFTNQSELAFMSLWNFGDGDSIVAHQPAEHFYHSVGEYLVSLITESNHGCRDTAYQRIVIDNINTFYAPNAIQPFSGYQDNRHFKPLILNINPDSYELFIYNRWGEFIFRTNNYELGWNGWIDGEIVKQGSYVWMVKYKDIFGIFYQKTGTVTVVY
ncbi:MAG: PKD domain-containing protein [Bacteroidota bacterium]|nr:PKD domain-containing protein [Bacteroidota bacterium]